MKKIIGICRSSRQHRIGDGLLSCTLFSSRIIIVEQEQVEFVDTSGNQRLLTAGEVQCGEPVRVVNMSATVQ
jgi:hypothetical protein